MKRHVVVLFLAGLAMTANANLLTNGDFNTGDFSGWWTWSPDPATQSISIETVYTYDSTSCAKMVSATDGAWQQLGQDFSIMPSTTYALSFMYDAAQWAGAGVAVKYFDASWNYLSYDWYSLANTTGWTSWNGSFTTPAGTGYAEVRFDEGSWGTMYIDNVVVAPEPATLLLLGAGGLLFRKR
ncbi:MAG: carbohydrate binding domain-containing protein [Planctomycetaceae bacterium]|nr:carbohydrate binding domain-containing protein [Planctomycetaceae bacterium]